MSKFWLKEGKQWTTAQGEVVRSIRPGAYKVFVHKGMFGTTMGLTEMETVSDAIIAPPASLTGRVFETVETFWGARPKYAKMGIVHKRGMLLEGRPGTGKTVICRWVGQRVATEYGGVSVFLDPTTPNEYLKAVLSEIRSIDTKIPVVTIMEDIEKQGVGSLLELLDGQEQVGNIFHIATTNFKGKMDKRLTDRPSRFDEVLHVGPPGRDTRLAYLTATLPADDPTIDPQALAEASQGLTFAQLKELAVAVYVYGRSPEVTLKRLREMGGKQAPEVTPPEEEIPATATWGGLGGSSLQMGG